MEYQNYRDRQELFGYIEKCFPYVEKPSDVELLIFPASDCLGQYIKEHLSIYSGSKLPLEAVMYLHDELRELSEKAISWLLPSLLRKAVLAEKYDSISEFLVFDLESEYEGCFGVKRRYSMLKSEQLICLYSILEFFSEEFDLMVASAQENIERLSEHY